VRRGSGNLVLKRAKKAAPLEQQSLWGGGISRKRAIKKPGRPVLPDSGGREILGNKQKLLKKKARQFDISAGERGGTKRKVGARNTYLGGCKGGRKHESRPRSSF